MIKKFKKIAFVLMGCLFSMSIFAQNTTHTKKASSTKSSASTLAPEKSSILCKAWKLDSLSEFGVDNKAKGKQANDAITFIADGSFFITMDGVASTGTWTYTGGRLNGVTKNPDNTFSFKIISLDDNRLVLDYQYPAPDLTRVSYTYIPKK